MGATNAPSNQSRVAGEKRSSTSVMGSIIQHTTDTATGIASGGRGPYDRGVDRGTPRRTAARLDRRSAPCGMKEL